VPFAFSLNSSNYGACNSVDVTDGDQTFLFDRGPVIRMPPTEDELDHALRQGAKFAISKHHRGPPPGRMEWSDLTNEVIVGALPRLRNFRHGGRKTLKEFAYMACYQSLKDIQRRHMWRNPDIPQSYPLFEGIA